MKNSSNTIGNRTRDLPACSAVPQMTAPPRTLKVYIKVNINSDKKVLAHFERSVLTRNKNVESHWVTCANPCPTKEGIWKLRVLQHYC